MQSTVDVMPAAQNASCVPEQVTGECSGSQSVPSAHNGHVDALEQWLPARIVEHGLAKSPKLGLHPLSTSFSQRVPLLLHAIGLVTQAVTALQLPCADATHATWSDVTRNRASSKHTLTPSVSGTSPQLLYATQNAIAASRSLPVKLPSLVALACTPEPQAASSKHAMDRRSVVT
jgi:hypothetical protein